LVAGVFADIHIIKYKKVNPSTATIHFKSISDMHKVVGVSKPNHPLFSILHFENFPTVSELLPFQTYHRSICNGYFSSGATLLVLWSCIVGDGFSLDHNFIEKFPQKSH
tara:strand:- start:5393 stop:5719 length:327 start_codon:yes stop_codon:yes gene_type:complete